jgi:PIN domain nuclease of toxin-antitoxin system
VRVLLDTSALLWWYASDAMLSTKARKLIADPSTVSMVSAASAWEICTKVRIGKLATAAPLCENFSRILLQNRFEPLPVTVEHGRLAGRLAGSHKDPFDRMLAAQSLIEGVPLVTNDGAFAAFGVQVFW